jgi:hypothetical protein
MNDNELKQLWASYNDKLDISIQINQKIAENTTDLRIKSLLGSMKPAKIATIIIGILWVLFVHILIVQTFGLASIFFTISAIIQVFVTQLAIGIYIYQLVMIQQIDISEPITVTQQKLSSLKTTSLTIARILFLQLPVWSTFYLHKAMFVADNFVLLIFQTVVTFGLTYLAIWLFFNIKLANTNKAWFKLLFEGKEWTPVIRSIELLEEIKAFRT